METHAYPMLQAYAQYALSHPHECKVVAIAEPRPKTQRQFADLHSVDQTLVFTTWRDLLAASTETITTVGSKIGNGSQCVRLLKNSCGRDFMSARQQTAKINVMIDFVTAFEQEQWLMCDLSKFFTCETENVSLRSTAKEKEKRIEK